MARRRFVEIPDAVRIDDDDDDDRSMAERTREAIDVWSSYGSYRATYLIISLPELCVVIAASSPMITVNMDGNNRLPLIFLWCDVFLHILRVLWSLVLFIRCSDRIRDYYNSANKFHRMYADKGLVVLHFLFAITFGSFAVHVTSNKFTTSFNMALYVVVMTCLIEMFFFVDPFSTPLVRDRWVKSADDNFVEIFQKGRLTRSQMTAYREKLLQACSEIQTRATSPGRDLFRSIAFVAVGVAEIFLLSVEWRSFCGNDGPYVQGWVLIDIVLNFGLAIIPLPDLSAVITTMCAKVQSPNPMALFRRAVGLHVLHLTWSIWGLIFLTWNSSCMGAPSSGIIVSSIVIVLSVEFLCLLRLWFLSDYVDTIYYLWCLAGPVLAGSLLHWIQIQVDDSNENLASSCGTLAGIVPHD